MGSTPERLRQQLEVVDELNAELAPFRILTGIEVDILEDGSLDQDDELLAQLDVVVASVHSKLRMDAPDDDQSGCCAPSRVRTPTSWDTAPAGSWSDAVAHSRPSTPRPSSPPAPQTGTAVEINSRPERLDPPETAARSRALARLCGGGGHRRPRAGPARVATPRLRAGGVGRASRSIGS